MFKRGELNINSPLTGRVMWLVLYLKALVSVCHPFDKSRICYFGNIFSVI